PIPQAPSSSPPLPPQRPSFELAPLIPRLLLVFLIFAFILTYQAFHHPTPSHPLQFPCEEIRLIILPLVVVFLLPVPLLLNLHRLVQPRSLDLFSVIPQMPPMHQPPPPFLHRHGLLHHAIHIPARQPLLPQLPHAQMQIHGRNDSHVPLPPFPPAKRNLAFHQFQHVHPDARVRDFQEPAEDGGRLVLNE
ncbi:MAG: hypothetical protein Q9181_007990, partial [Wetmoreana brouardii]